MQRVQPLSGALALVIGLAAGFPAFAQSTEGTRAADDPVEIVAFGDSLVAGYGVGPGEAFPERLQAALDDRGYDVTVVNAGVSGDTTSGGLSRLEWSVPNDAELVIVELGANDALRGVNPDIARDNLDRILTTLGEREQPVILAGMIAPPNMGADYAERFDPIYADLAQKHDVTLYPFFLDGVAAQPDLNQDDGMHPNAEGVSIIVDNILPTVTEKLEEIGVEPASSTGG